MPEKIKRQRLKETFLINKIEEISRATRWFNKSLIIKSIGDDCAIFKDKGNILISTDNITEKIHFTLEKYSFYEIGAKSLLVNLSDIAAMGGNPRLFTLSFFIPRYISNKNIMETLDGIIDTAKKYRISLVGGNISGASEYSISITIIGDYNNNYVLTRGMSEPGDAVFVSGELGNAWLSYLINYKIKNMGNIDKTARRGVERFLKRFKLPAPRIELGKILAKTKLARNLTDVSDGIFKDINNICGHGAEIQMDKLPVNKELKNIVNLLNIKNLFDGVISFGEDYELLWTGKKESEKKLLEISKKLGIRITRIGRITDQYKGIKFLNRKTLYPIKDFTYEHI